MVSLIMVSFVKFNPTKVSLEILVSLESIKVSLVKLIGNVIPIDPLSSPMVPFKISSPLRLDSGLDVSFKSSKLSLNSSDISSSSDSLISFSSSSSTPPFKSSKFSSTGSSSTGSSLSDQPSIIPPSLFSTTSFSITNPVNLPKDSKKSLLVDLEIFPSLTKISVV